MSESEKSSCICIRNISKSVSEETIRSIFSKAGPIKSVRIQKMDPANVASLRYSSPTAAGEAVRILNGYKLNGLALRVKEAKTIQPEDWDEYEERGFQEFKNMYYDPEKVKMLTWSSLIKK